MFPGTELRLIYDLVSSKNHEIERSEVLVGSPTDGLLQHQFPSCGSGRKTTKGVALSAGAEGFATSRACSINSARRTAMVRNSLPATTTETGTFKVRCELDLKAYPRGIKVSDAEMATLNIKGDAFHPEWNYTISPRPRPITPKHLFRCVA